MIDITRMESAIDRIVRGVIAEDSSKWVTVHPGGKGTKTDGSGQKGGVHVLIDSESGKILGGMGKQNKGKTIKQVKTTKKEQSKTKTKNIPQKASKTSNGIPSTYQLPKHTFNEPTAWKGSSAHDACTLYNPTDEQKRVMRGYTKGGKWMQMNKQLITGGELTSGQKKMRDDLDAVLNESTTKVDMVLYQGKMHFDKWAFKDKYGKKGKVVEGDGFQSLTDSFQIAKNFNGPRKDFGLIEYHIPAGSHAVSMKSISDNKGESEILLSRKHSVKIIGTKVVNGYTVTVVEVV